MDLENNGTYVITWWSNGNALDVSGNDNRSCIIFQRHGAVNQQWTLEQVGHSTYRIRGAGGYISFVGSAHHDPPIECSENQQVWRIAPVANLNDHYYIIHDRHDGNPLFLSVTSNGQRVQLRDYNPASPQIWQFGRLN